jgi:hypothetical protein
MLSDKKLHSCLSFRDMSVQELYVELSFEEPWSHYALNKESLLMLNNIKQCLDRWSWSWCNWIQCGWSDLRWHSPSLWKLLAMQK